MKKLRTSKFVTHAGNRTTRSTESDESTQKTRKRSENRAQTQRYKTLGSDATDALYSGVATETEDCVFKEYQTNWHRE